jgi:hypothetical protein
LFTREKEIMLNAAERQLQKLIPHHAHGNAILKKTLEKGTGWYCIGKIKPGEIILSVPAAAWLPYSTKFASMEAARNSSQFIQSVHKLVSDFKEVNIKADGGADVQKLESSIHLAVKLMLDADDNDPYMSALVAQSREASYVPLPITLKNSSELKILEGTSAYKAVKERQLMYNYFADQLFGAGSPNAAKFVWAMSQILSRALSSPPHRSAESVVESESVPFTLVPMLDFVNHSLKPNAMYKYCGKQHQFALHPLREIEDEEEITISYGEQRSNSSFFALYGFLDLDNNILGALQYSLQARFSSPSAGENSAMVTVLNDWKLDQCSVVVRGDGADGGKPPSGGVLEISDASMSVSFTADRTIFHYLDELELRVPAGTANIAPADAAAFAQPFRAAFEDVLHCSRICMLQCEDVLVSDRSGHAGLSEDGFRAALALIQGRKYILASDRGVESGIISLQNEVAAVCSLVEYIEKEKLVPLASAAEVVVGGDNASSGRKLLESYCRSIVSAERSYWQKMLVHMESYLVLLLAANSAGRSGQ